MLKQSSKCIGTVLYAASRKAWGAAEESPTGMVVAVELSLAITIRILQLPAYNEVSAGFSKLSILLMGMPMAWFCKEAKIDLRDPDSEGTRQLYARCLDANLL